MFVLCGQGLFLLASLSFTWSPEAVGCFPEGVSYVGLNEFMVQRYCNKKIYANAMSIIVVGFLICSTDFVGPCWLLPSKHIN